MIYLNRQTTACGYADRFNDSCKWYYPELIDPCRTAHCHQQGWPTKAVAIYGQRNNQTFNKHVNKSHPLAACKGGIKHPRRVQAHVTSTRCSPIIFCPLNPSTSDFADKLDIIINQANNFKAVRYVLFLVTFHCVFNRPRVMVDKSHPKHNGHAIQMFLCPLSFGCPMSVRIPFRALIWVLFVPIWHEFHCQLEFP